jgi:hypothetical protein
MSYRTSFIIAFIYALRTKKITFIQVFLLGLVAIFSFILTFVPFVWNHFEEFKIMNPFIVQSTFLVPFQYTLLFIGLATIAGFLCKSINDVYFYSAVVLFLSILIYFIFLISSNGFQKTYFESLGDVSYFILCIPFVFFHMLKEESISVIG